MEPEQGDNGDGNDRKLQNGNYFYYEVVSCQECVDMGCIDPSVYNMNDQGYYYNYNNENGSLNSDESTLAEISEWAIEVQSCSETQQVWSNLQVYSGFKCSANQKGIELAMFLDSQCTLEADNLSYNDVGTTSQIAYWSQSSEILSYPFQNEIDCADKLSYAPKGYKQVSDQNLYASYPCQLLFQYGRTIMLDDCSDGSVPGKTSMGGDQSWYKYELSQSALEDNMEACPTVYKAYEESKHLGPWGRFFAVVFSLLIIGGASYGGYTYWKQSGEPPLSCSCLETQKLTDPVEDARGEKFIVMDDGDGKVIL